MKKLIEKLKENWMGWQGLDVESKDLLKAMNKIHEVVVAIQSVDTITWPGKSDDKFRDGSIYRIHKAYEESTTPVFPGYVLHEVLGESRHVMSALNCKVPLSNVVDQPKFAGYVFKERLDVLHGSPVAFIDADGELCVNTSNGGLENNGTKPATLGWVVFKTKGGGE